MTIFNCITLTELVSKFIDSKDKSVERQPRLQALIPQRHPLDWKWHCDNGDEPLPRCITFSNDQVLLIHPDRSSGSTAVRCNKPLKRNAFTFWEITISDRIFGTSIMIGVGKTRVNTSSIAYINLLGADENSWGLSHKGKLWHAGRFLKDFSGEFVERKAVKVGCLYDGFRGRLSYFIDGVFMGLAFDKLPVDEPLYPMVSATISQCLFRLDLCYQSFQTLQDLCVNKIDSMQCLKEHVSNNNQHFLPFFN